jgi:hydroxymethylglutaryl-CoA lyase
MTRYISSIFTDPITSSPTPFFSVHKCTTTLLAAGIYEVSLGDTTGTGTPSLVRSLLTYLTTHEAPVPVSKLAGHFHDSHGRGLKNVWEAYLFGVRVFDSSVAGLGGCPFAPGAKGNVATEEVVGMLEGRGVKTGVDARVLAEVAEWVRREVLEEGELEGERKKEKEPEKGTNGSGLGHGLANLNTKGALSHPSRSPVRPRIPTNWTACGFVRPVVYD